jgi:hypothetical protein
MKRIILDCNIFVSALPVPGSGPVQILDLARERKIELLGFAADSFRNYEGNALPQAA